ncbi:aminotransferase class I/II-fold pyridoxal phosphate-dependent enzyme, partial [Actinacidiphila rubida]|uniref:aminotransferase class I/II-fold pyridoxal phosphate-dependent enzyme n=1 Tax=Actinacidiphila rubida TaxID=310780 RepID=UPI00114D028B
AVRGQRPAGHRGCAGRARPRRGLDHGVGERLHAQAAGWLSDGTADTIAAAKRADAADRRRIAAEALAGLAVRADPRAYFCWWDLPEPWRADTFVAAAARRGIAVTPGASFAVGPHRAPNAVRVGLASPPPAELRRALTVLADLARISPEAAAPE